MLRIDTIKKAVVVVLVLESELCLVLFQRVTPQHDHEALILCLQCFT